MAAMCSCSSSSASSGNRADVDAVSASAVAVSVAGTRVVWLEDGRDEGFSADFAESLKRKIFADGVTSTTPLLASTDDVFAGARRFSASSAKVPSGSDGTTFTRDGLPPYAAALSADALFFVEVGTTRLVRWDRATTARTELATVTPVCARCLTVDRTRVFVGLADGVHGFDATTGAWLGMIPTGGLTLVAVSASGGHVAFGGSGVGAGVYVASSDGDDVLRVSDVAPDDVQLSPGWVTFASRGHGLVRMAISGTEGSGGSSREVVEASDVVQFAVSESVIAWMVDTGPRHRLFARLL